MVSVGQCKQAARSRFGFGIAAEFLRSASWRYKMKTVQEKGEQYG
jgi:hypothetical protein